MLRPFNFGCYFFGSSRRRRGPALSSHTQVSLVLLITEVGLGQSYAGGDGASARLYKRVGPERRFSEAHYEDSQHSSLQR